MDIIEIIENKKNKLELTEKEINYFIQGYVDNKFPDYQMASLLMAIRLNGLKLEEIVNMTNAMVNSGEVIEYKHTDKLVVDKHSTGGVGDKTSLVLVPLLASLDFVVSKMSGRGLGFTGGTLDKLEAIEGFNINLTSEGIKKSVEEIGCVIVGQNDKIVPADKKIYALRDVTGTVDSLGLIASSIMSKKIALGAQVILLDVKYGSGGFMKTYEDAKQLAVIMKDIGDALGRKVVCFISSMDQPLGKNIGNSLEVQEAYETLGNQGNDELKELCVLIATEAVVIRDSINYDEAKKIVEEKIISLAALNKFEQLIKNQGGNIDKLHELEISNKVYEFKIDIRGYVEKIETDKIGLAAMELGAGRKKKEDTIDYSVGLEVLCKIGSKVDAQTAIVKIHYKDEQSLRSCIEVLNEAFLISDKHVEKPPLIKTIIK